MPESIADVMNKQLAKIIAGKRKRMNLSQQQVAKRAGVSRPYYSDIERGLRNISIESLARISEALGSTSSDMLRLVETSVKAQCEDKENAS